MQARTLTHGDLSAFEADLAKLVDKKAEISAIRFVSC